MLATVFEVLTGLLAGPLLVAGVAKLATPPGKLSWPYGSGLLRVPHGPRLVGAGEGVAAVALVLLPGPFAPLLGVAAYALLTGTAYRLRGQDCACFGLARLAAVGQVHIAANAGGAAVAAALVFATPQGDPVARGVGAGASAILVAGVLLVLDRRQQTTASRPEPCTERVSGVHLYVSATCPACRSLEGLLASMEPARQNAIRTTVVGDGTKLPTAMADLGVPAATAVNEAGTPICRPVSGIGAVKGLIDTITIGSPTDTRAQ